MPPAAVKRLVCLSRARPLFLLQCLVERPHVGVTMDVAAPRRRVVVKLLLSRAWRLVLESLAEGPHVGVAMDVAAPRRRKVLQLLAGLGSPRLRFARRRRRAAVAR